jgi:glucose-6-phosphate 1-dehydrogenase
MADGVQVAQTGVGKKQERIPDPCIVVIFGASGDLTKRKLLPALFHLEQQGLLPENFSVVGVARRDISATFSADMQEGIEKFGGVDASDPKLKGFMERVQYFATNFDDDAGYEKLKGFLAGLDTKFGTKGNRLFYLAVAPEYFADITQRLSKQGMTNPAEPSWAHVIIEKPFGTDLESAKKLNDEINQVLKEEQIFRIDHYLGKETVQNILAFRFGNGIFEPLWNRRYVNHVQITAAESIGVEGRGSYYQEAGALRDMIQNHLSQVMATIAMEPSATFRPNSVRDERSKLLRSIRVMKPDEVLRNTVSGQYGPARIGGEDVPGFRQEQGVKPDTQTDTYAAVTFFVDNWRWAGVPFYLRSGKRLPKRVTEIAIQFNAAPLAIFNGDETTTAPNLLILRIQPEEGISLKFLSKRPGAGMKLRPVSMDFNYGSSFGERSPSAYETLLLDAIIGDATLYTRQDMVEASWAVVDAVQHVWDSTKFDFPNYAAGTWGPKASDEMLARRGHVWRQP